MNRADEPCDGVPIVLTASAIEMSDFGLNPFIAFTGGFPTKIVPRRILKKRLYPMTRDNDDGAVAFAPYGLRKIETVLAREFGESNVVACTPPNLHRFVGPNTKVIGISTMDPLGMGFVSRTYTSLVGFGGEPISAAEFRGLIKNQILRKYGSKIIVGGSGAWQIIRGRMQDAYGINVVIMGEGEHTAPIIFRTALNGEPLPRVVEAEKPKLEEIPTITNPSLFGVVEITRGCGKGCQFCSPTMRTFYSFPLEKIKKEAELNARAGSKMVVLQTDDIFLYKHRERFAPNRKAVVELVNTIGKIGGVEYLQPAHAALSPVVYDPKMIEEIAPMLVEKGRWECHGRKVASVEVGIETGSVRLMEKYMRGKALPLDTKDWPEIVVQAVGILNDNDIYPLATLVVGLPGEEERDTLATMELVDRLKGAKLFYVPLFFTSEEECLLSSARQADLHHLTELHWDFFAKCWSHNIKTWAPDNQRKVAVGSMLLYMLYYRWKHGPRVARPIMKLADFPTSLLKVRSETQNPHHKSAKIGSSLRHIQLLPQSYMIQKWLRKLHHTGGEGVPRCPMVNLVVEARKKYFFAIVGVVVLVMAVLAYLFSQAHWGPLAANTVVAILLCIFVALFILLPLWVRLTRSSNYFPITNLTRGPTDDTLSIVRSFAEATNIGDW